MKPRLIFLALALILLTVSISALIPKYIRVQGLALDTDSQYITVPHNMTFKIYPQQSGGGEVYSETHSGANTIPFTRGWFDTNIGMLTILDLNFRSSEFRPSQYFVGITIGTDSEMIPRLPIRSAPYCSSPATSYDLNCTNCVNDNDLDNGLTIVTASDFNVTGTADIYNLNTTTLAVGTANQPSIAGDVNVSGNIEIAPDKKLIMPGTPFVYWVSAAEYITSDTNKIGDGYTANSAYCTANCTLKLKMPNFSEKFNSSMFLSEIGVYYSGVNTGGTHVDNIALVQNNMGSDVNGTTPRLTYATNITSGTYIDLNSTNMAGMPYTMQDAPYSLNIDLNVQSGDQIDLHFIRLEYYMG
ncbi:MAG: hypothetical protein ABH854_03490 [Candidatus Diapherotrites archaeon]|nr:hypothetical protein [Candidatus Micrarchaeota archaeon]MBU1939135.1 hypothetical protein [Candidatus Micrarchaeota archaeon]